MEVQETERHHLARELYDQIGQPLTAVKINLQNLGRLAETSPLEPHLENSITIVEQALQQVRDLSLDLRPAELSDFGLVPALRQYLNRQAQRAGFGVAFDADPFATRLPSALETVCFRVT